MNDRFASLRRYVPLWCLAFSASGCLLGPNHVAPPVELPERYEGDRTQARLPAPDVELAVWWKQLHDPGLDALIERGLKQNLDLAQATARLRQARAERIIAGAPLLPAVGVTASGRRSGSEGRSRVSTASDGTVLNSGSAGPRDLFEAGFDAAWELDIFGGTRREIEAANAAVDAAQAGLHDVEVSLVSEIAVNWIHTRSLQEQERLLHANRDIAEHTAEILERRFGAGFVGAADLALARAEAASIEAQLPAIRSQIDAQRFALNTLLGEPAEHPRPELEAGATFQPQLSAPPDDSPSALLQRRPDIRQAEAELHRATAEVGVAAADLFPRFSLSAFFGAQGSRVSALDSWRNTLWNFGGSAAQTLFAGGRLVAAKRVAEALRAEQLASYENTVLRALQEVETNYRSYQAARERIPAVERSLQEFRRAFDAASALSSSGATEYLTLLSAQRAVLNSERELLQAQTDGVTSLIALYKSLGGGWSVGSSPGEERSPS